MQHHCPFLGPWLWYNFYSPSTLKILITGSNGLLGQKLVELLAAKQLDFVATARGENRLVVPGASFQYRSLDVTNEAEVEQAIAELQPTVVINTAGMTNVDQCETDHEGCDALNVLAVRYLAQSCAKHDVFLLHLSTDFIFDGEAGPYKEDAAANPLSYYGHSKLKGELEVMAVAGLRWSIARTVLVYGIAQNMSRSNIILWVKGSLEQGKQIKVVTDQWRTPTLAEDLAIGCYLIAEKQAEGIFNISGPDMLTPYDMAIATADYFGLDKSLITEADSSTFTQPAKRPPRTGFDITKARTELGYEPRTFAQGIAFMAAQLPQ